MCIIMNVLQQCPAGVTFSALVEQTGIGKSTVFRYLWTLQAERYVERIAEHEFRLGLGFLGMHSRRVETLRSAVRPWLWRLRDSIGETAKLGILVSDGILYLDIAVSPHRYRFWAARGDRTTLHASALGKAIAADLPEERVWDILDRAAMEPRTPNTITTSESFLVELTKVRDRGYAIDDGESDADGRCVAVAIPHVQSAALSICAPAARLSMEEVSVVASRLQKAADHIARSLQARSPEDATASPTSTETSPTCFVSDEKLVSWHERGDFTIADIAMLAGTTTDDVRKRLVASGVEIREEAPPKRSRHEFCVSDDQLVAWYEDDRLSLATIAKRVGKDPATVRKRLVASGVKIRLKGWRHVQLSVPDEQLVAWYEDDKLGVDEIARRADSSYRTVRNRLTERGVKIRTPGRVAETPGTTKVSHRVQPSQRTHSNVADEKLIALYADQKLTLAATAARTGIGVAEVRRRLVACGVPIRPRGGGQRAQLKMTNDELVAGYVNDRKTLQQLAEQAGTTAVTVRHRLRNCGVTLRGPGARQSPARQLTSDELAELQTLWNAIPTGQGVRRQAQRGLVRTLCTSPEGWKLLNRVRELHKLGVPYTEIENKLMITYSNLLSGALGRLDATGRTEPRMIKRLPA